MPKPQQPTKPDRSKQHAFANRLFADWFATQAIAQDDASIPLRNLVDNMDEVGMEHWAKVDDVRNFLAAVVGGQPVTSTIAYDFLVRAMQDASSEMPDDVMIVLSECSDLLQRDHADDYAALVKAVFEDAFAE